MKKCKHEYYVQNQMGMAECADCGLLATTIKEMAKENAPYALPSVRIRAIHEKRREMAERGELDEIDMLFGKCSVLEKSIIQYHDEEYEK
jgi:hypothetical protein